MYKINSKFTGKKNLKTMVFKKSNQLVHPKDLQTYNNSPGPVPIKFKIVAKRIFLTYSNLPKELNIRFLVDQLDKNLFFDKYLIAPEKHQDGTLDYYVVLYRNKKFNIKSQATLDIQFKGQLFHAKYEPVKSFEKLVRNLCKNKNYSTTFENIRDGEVISMEEDLFHHVQTNNVDQTIRHFIKNYPRQALRGINASNAARLLEGLKLDDTHEEESTHQKELLVLNKMPVQFSDLKLPSQLTEWMKKLKPTLLLVGDSGTGKTFFCQALAEEKKLNLLQINHVSGLRNITRDHQILLFDHFDFKNIEDDQLFSLLDTQEEHLIPIFRGSVKKPKGLVQIVNLYPKQLKSLRKRLDKVEILGRICIIHLDQPIADDFEFDKVLSDSQQ